MAQTVQRRRHQEPAQLSRLAPRPRSLGRPSHSTKLDQKRHRKRAIPTTNAVRAFPVERYRDCIHRYHSDLPTEPGTGNFVLADFEARSLRALFADEARYLPSTFSSRLKSILESHFALRACYPTVARMYEAINTGRLQELPPFDEFERFNKAVAEHQEHFEPEVLQGLEQISRPEALVPRQTVLPSTTT